MLARNKSKNQCGEAKGRDHATARVVKKIGMIELTEAGFRRLGQAHSAGLDTVIEVDRRHLLHYPASKPKFAGAAAS